MGKLQVLATFCFVLALALIGIITNPGHVSTRAVTFKIGALLCLTGDCAEWGSNSLKGIQLAIEEINATGGVLGRQIEIVVQDSREANGGGNAVSAFRELTLDPEVRYVIGPTWTAGGLPLAPILAKDSDLLITSPSLGVSQFNETATNIFNIWPHDSEATSGLAHFAIRRGYKRIAILSSNDAWVATQGDTFEKEFNRLGGEVTIKVVVDPGTREIRTEALKIHQTAPDAVFYADTYNMSKVARELNTLRFSGAQFSILMDDTRVREAQGALEGTYFAMYPEASAEFQGRYQRRYGEKAGVAADTGYDTVKLYVAAINQAKTFDAKIVGPIMQELELNGASGLIVFDGKGGIKRQPSFYQVKSGSFVKEDT